MLLVNHTSDVLAYNSLLNPNGIFISSQFKSNGVSMASSSMLLNPLRHRLNTPVKIIDSAKIIFKSNGELHCNEYTHFLVKFL